jgi:hypothetical protein
LVCTSSDRWILAVIINPVNALVSTGDPAYVLCAVLSCHAHDSLIPFSIIAVLDSIADIQSVAHINHHLCKWMHHQANNPVEGSLNIKTIPAQVSYQ